MIKEEVLAEFREAHPKLFELKPDVSVYEIIESSEEGWEQMEKPVYQIDVKHPFIFDVRLIPSEFNGIRVKNVFGLLNSQKNVGPQLKVYCVGQSIQ